MKKIPEIVAPWGSHNKALVAAHYWADAIYLWVPFTSLRMRQNKIKTFDELKETINQLHQLKKQAYLTMNIFPRNIDIKIFENVVEQVSSLGADAIIFSDPGTYNIIRRYLPNMPLHLSTQTSTLNHESVKFWYDLGVKRVVLARELNIKEIEQIKKSVPDMELEIFVHGAMCVAYSGRCLLGEYFSGRDWNKWECSHVCRYWFKVHVEEEKRPWKMFEVQEDEKWTYIFSSRDLCTIERLWEILPFVDWLKIEWRSKSEFYVWSSVMAYKHVADAIINNKPIDEKIKNLVYQIPHRNYRDGFVLNTMQDYPDGEWVSTVSYDNAGPVIDKVYYGLVLPEFVEKDWKKYHKFIPKQTIDKWTLLDYNYPGGVGELKIEWLLSDTSEPIESIHCNMKYAYINCDKTLNWREVLYK